MDCDIAGYHVESFNYLTDEGLHSAAVDVPTVKLRLPHGDAVEFSYTSARLGYPALENTNKIGQNLELTKIYPSECRQRGLTYATTLSATIDFSVNGKKIDSVETVIGEVPVMLMSKHCNLHGFNREQLIRHGEEGNERGGYFVVNGSEKVVRLLVANKRNFPLAIQRASHRDKGQLFSDSAVMMRCVRGNFAAAAINLHYLESASITMSLQYRRELFYVPLMYVLRALTDMNDAMIYEHLTRGRPGDTFWANCVTNMLVTAQEEGVVSQQAACVALGTRFRVALGNMIAPWEPDEAAAHYLLKYCVAIHLDTNEEKFFCLALMAHKLIALVKNEITSESLDNPQFQEASVSGHIMLLLIREKMESILTSARSNLEKSANKRTDTFTMNNNEMLKALKVGELTHHLRNFLSTGNLKTNNGLGLMQTNGFSVIAERINYLRFVSHFRAIHRGAFFTEMRTTDVRKLRPEAWGFICPVHTPDGAPCGLLNHITATCRIVTHYSVTRKIEATLTSLGMLPHKLCTLVKSESLFPVIVDGNFLGYIPREKAWQIERQLRGIKVNKDDDRIPYITEITLIRHSPDPANVMTQFPGLYLYTSPGRMIRPVYNLLYQVREYIGIFEQVYLSIIIDPEEAEPGVTIHQELHPSALFSFAGNLIPFPDHNQSPRNVYQCQMGKQTMGVPVHAWRHRADNKMYLLQTPQKPLLKLESHDIYEMDEYPLGTNACVAVISYTGYDMEDAMVINKSSYQRGFAHGGVIKVERINLAENKRQGFGKGVPDEFFFGDMEKLPSTITEDGLPIPGRLYRKDDIYYSTFDTVSGKFKTYKFKSEEPAYCLLVRIVDEGQVKQKVHALIQWRITRNPIIGDKFASRHGQKGINSFLWPAESLPFSDSGMVPDIIFNPHGFPSRMTIGMMIESMAGKAAAMHGTSYDASPFVFNEENTAIDHFGKLLQKAGFNHHGNETLYSGINGKEMEVQIFFGIVYYQRLRHMIADKFQVRATGPVDPVTLQPVKGRKMGGGIRFGEMERDALIAHGTAFCLQDRLFNCSDKDEAYMCASCGSLVSVAQLRPHMAISRKIESAFHKHNATIKDTNFHNAMKRHCTVCKRDDQVFLVQVPRVFRYLCAELSSVNVKVQLRINHPKNLKH